MPFFAEGNDVLFLAGKGCVIPAFRAKEES